MSFNVIKCYNLTLLLACKLNLYWSRYIFSKYIVKILLSNITVTKLKTYRFDKIV